MGMHEEIDVDVGRTNGGGAMYVPRDVPESSRAAEFCSTSIMKLAGALAKAQGAFGPIERTRTVTVRPKPKDGREMAPYTFSYAPLDVVLAATVPALTANGLSVISLPIDGGNRLRTLLLHESGEWLAIEVNLPEYQGPQAFGSALTYMRRYSIVALLGVASEEDDDGNAAEGNSVERKAERPARAQESKPQPAAPAGPWRAKDDDGTAIMDAEVEEFDGLIEKLGWKPNMVTLFLNQRFGVTGNGGVRALTRQNYKAAAKLLVSRGIGKEAYEKTLAELIAAGQVKP